MSYWGKWICPKCKKELVCGIGWYMPPSIEELNDLIERICGCTKKKLTKKQMKKAQIITKI